MTIISFSRLCLWTVPAILPDHDKETKIGLSYHLKFEIFCASVQNCQVILLLT